jgi:hypothetical protein
MNTHTTHIVRYGQPIHSDVLPAAMKLFYRNVLVTLALSLALGAFPFGCSQSNGAGGAGGSGSGGSGTTGGAGGAEVLSCTVADDCRWGDQDGDPEEDGLSLPVRLPLPGAEQDDDRAAPGAVSGAL